MTKVRIISQEENDEKLSKDDALYLEHKGTDYECKDCIFYKEKRCALYGKEVDIKPFGSCNYWMDNKIGVETDWLNTTTKKESGYEENKDGYTCGRCEYFLEHKKQCKKVKGTIVSTGCCNLWSK